LRRGAGRTLGLAGRQHACGRHAGRVRDRVGLSQLQAEGGERAADPTPAFRCYRDIGNAHQLTLHAAARWLWAALVAKLLAEDWTVETART
jgi:hypothetical protein